MGDKISQLPAASTVDGTEVIPIVQGGATKKVAGSILRVPTGSAGGDLGGSYPNPTLAAITTAQSNVGSSSVIPVLSIDAKGRVTALSTAANPQGTVTSVTGGTGLTGGTITSSGTLAVSYGTTAGTAAQGNDSRLSDSRTPSGAAGGDLAGTYPNPTLATVTTAKSNIGSSTMVPVISVDAKGRITSLSSTPISSSTGGTVTSITGGTGLTGGTITSSGTLAVAYGTTAGTAAEGNDSRLSDSRSPSGAAGGDLAGIYPNPTLNTVAVGKGGTGQTSYTDGQLLIGNSTGNTLTKATLTAGANVTITNGPGTITIAASLSPSPYTADTLVVAGGGGANSGGGGAGGMQSGSVSLTPGTTYSIIVGAGGAGTSGNTTAVAGSDSSISVVSITSLGGGRSGTFGTPNGTTGGNGGSGGGAGANASITNTLISGGSGTSGQGNNGGGTPGFSGAPSGGGGGAGAAGANGSSLKGGDGGVGLQSSITGSAVYYAGGGGGSVGSGTRGNGGLGGGGNGAIGAANGSAGTANTGGGGGAGQSGSSFSGGQGGSGVVILSVPTAKYTGTVTGSPTITTSGSNTIITFTASGSYTA